MTQGNGAGTGSLEERRRRRLRRLGRGLALVPLGIVAFFAVAEGIGREPGWLGHVLQLVLLGVPVVVAWRRPRIGWALLLAGAAVFLVAILVPAPRLDAVPGVLVLIVLPLVVAALALRASVADASRGR